MVKALCFSGDDHAATRTDRAIGLGYRLKQVTQEDLLERQPLLDGDIMLVGDLRLDNREDLARVLGLEDRLVGLPDSVLAMRAYAKWGEECAQHLLGDFALAIWDSRKQQLWLAVDHMGQRDCYFHLGARGFYFASEIKALWACPGIPRVLDDAAIARMLMIDVSPRPGVTAYEGIEVVPGGHSVTINSKGDLQRREYWRPHPDPVHVGRDEAYYIAAYREVLGEAIACRLRRTREPAGLVFSGGYDSAGIAALAGPPLLAQGRKLTAVCSAIEEDNPAFPRNPWKWAEYCRRDMPHLNVCYIARGSKNALTNAEEAFRDGDGRIGPSHMSMRAIFAELKRAGVCVIMDGFGGDQTLNPRGYGVIAWLLKKGRLGGVLRELRGYRRMVTGSWASIVRSEIIIPLLPNRLRGKLRLMRRRLRPYWTDWAITGRFAEQMIAEGRAQVGGEDALNRDLINIDGEMLRGVEVQRFMHGAGTLARSHGLELTRPFFDKRVVELALAIPPDLHVRNGRNRYLACKALADLYPPEYQTRSRGNDALLPDFAEMAVSMRADLLAEINRLERNESLAEKINFPLMRARLVESYAGESRSQLERRYGSVIVAVLNARFVAWFRRMN